MIFEFIDGTVVRTEEVCCYMQKENKIDMIMKSGVKAFVGLESCCAAIIEFGRIVSELRPSIEELGNGLFLLRDMIINVNEIAALGKEKNTIFIVFKNGSSLQSNYEENNTVDMEKDFDELKRWLRKY